MGSLGMEEGKRRKAMWLYPKVVGFNPPERWGHSACFLDGVVFVFGGCCGGLHFSDVLALNLETMVWSSLTTTGQKPGTRDSHSTALVGSKMIVFGGTNGSKKVNDLHVLDLRTKEWSKPNCKGIPPSPRESHSATVVGNNKLVIFGGSGEGEANYLNDVHILDINNMTWTSPEVKGDLPAPRDSHTALAIGNTLLIYGGDCGNRYHGEVDVLDVDTMAWSRLAVQGSSPGVRAGHAAVNIGSQVYIIGGVGDKQYYSDVWVLDMASCTWIQLEIRGQHPQGRFSHTALVINTDIAIYGGCGEDERPLNELLILQLGSEHPNGRYNISMCKIFGSHWSQEKHKLLRSDNLEKSMVKRGGEHSQLCHDVEKEPRNSIMNGLDKMQTKRRKTSDGRVWDIESEQEEHSLSLSQHSSPSQSDQEQNTVRNLSTSPNGSISVSQQFVDFKLHHPREQANGIPRTVKDNLLSADSLRKNKTEQFLRAIPQSRQEVLLAAGNKPQPRPTCSSLIGADVHGTVDGAFDSGFLMTAVVNGQIFRGVLFAPGPGVAAPRPVIHSHNLTNSTVVLQHRQPPSHAMPIHARTAPHQTNFLVPDCGRRPVQVVKAQPERLNSDLQGVVLTLGGPGGGGGGSGS